MSDAAPIPKHKLRVPRPRRGAVRVLVGTRKGAFAIDGDASRSTWEVAAPWHLGSTVFHAVADPRRRGAILVAARDPRGEPVILRTEDGGERWAAADEPPAFEPGASPAREVRQVFWLTPGHAQQPGRWYCGTSPQGLFRSDDGGRTWMPVGGLHEAPRFGEWTDPASDRTPDGPKLHSVLVDPRDSDRLVVGLSTGGVLASDDAGASWRRLERGLEGDAVVAPQSVVTAPTNPDRLWMQNHFGVYRMDREDETWRRVGARDRAGAFDDAGFPIAVHPHDPDCAFVVPMDGSDAWPRTPAGGRPAVLRTKDGGATWARLDRGLPASDTYWTVKRQCLATDGHDPLGVYFGTSSGDVWASFDEGGRWRCIARGLPHVYSVEIV
ncbi:MAG: glycosyl hydrolase [Planctomycetota bacterium]